MTRFDPALYSRNLRRSTTNHIPVSFSDQRFLDQVAESTKIFDVKKRVLPGPVRNTEEEGSWKKEKEQQVASVLNSPKQGMHV